MPAMTNGLSLTAPRGGYRHDGLTFDFAGGRFASRTGAGMTVYTSAGERVSAVSAPKFTRRANGALVAAPANTLAFEWDASGAPLGLLIENAATNLMLHSADFSAAQWTLWAARAFGSGSVANAANAPDGTATADLLTEDGSAAAHYMSQNTTLQAGPNTLSCFVKRPAANARRWTALYSYAATPGVSYGAFFDLQNGTVGNTVGGSTARMSAYADGWWRCELTVNLGVTSFASFSPCLSSDLQSITYQGDNASGLLFWGAQAEQGATASSYVPSGASAATRAADTISFTPAAAELASDQGTALVEFALRRTSAGDAGVVSRGGAGFALVTNGNAIRTSDGTNVLAPASGALTPGAIYRAACQWGAAENDLRATAKIGAAATSASGPFDGAMGAGTVVLGDLVGVRLEGWLRRLETWPTRQSDAATLSMVQ